jgi:hypothetical protein
MDATEYELLDELEDEIEEEAMELEALSSPQGLAARKYRGIPVREPRQPIGKVACSQSSAHNVANPLSVLKKARERALDMLDKSIDELVNARRAVCAGATPGRPLLGDITICWLKNGLGVNIDDIRVWTAGTFEPIRSVAEVIRRLVRVRNLLGSSGLRYSCTGSLCASNPTWWAYTTPYDAAGNCLPGTPLMLIRLCGPFWIAGTLVDGTPVRADVHAEFQAQTLIHEASHLTHCTGDLRGRTIGVAECLAQFVAATNDSWLDPRFVDVCVGAERCPAETKIFQGESPGPGFAHRGSKGMRILGTIFRPQNAIRLKGRPPVRSMHETEPEFEDEYFDEPYQWPQWPTSRAFNPPPAQTIPAGPFKTFSPCQAIEDDFTKLVLAVDDLKNELRQRPTNLARVSNRADVVTALSRQAVARLQKLSYAQQGCTRQDMSLFASSVNAMRGRGADADTGSWPPAASPSVQGPRRQARESLRHLLNWIRRAERNFPRI